MDESELSNGLYNLIGHDTEDILWWQMSIRAILVFTFGLVLIRLFGRSAFGKRTALDLILAIIIGSNLSRAITANTPFLPTIAATALLAVCFWLLDCLCARWSGVSRLVKGEPIPVLQNGRFDRRRMLRAGRSEGDIEESARQSGCADLKSVDSAVLERSGAISVVQNKQ